MGLIQNALLERFFPCKNSWRLASCTISSFFWFLRAKHEDFYECWNFIYDKFLWLSQTNKIPVDSKMHGFAVSGTSIEHLQANQICTAAMQDKTVPLINNMRAPNTLWQKNEDYFILKICYRNFMQVLIVSN